MVGTEGTEGDRDRGKVRAVCPQLADRLVPLRKCRARLGTDRLSCERYCVGLLPP